MIKGVGTDIVNISRVEKACQNKAFLLRCFTDDERRLIGDNFAVAAGNFAVKESVAKCFGTGVSGFGLNEIEVLRDGKGKPYVNLYGEAAELAASLNIDRLFVTISDTDDTVVAFAVAEEG